MTPALVWQRAPHKTNPGVLTSGLTIHMDPPFMHLPDGVMIGVTNDDVGTILVMDLVSPIYDELKRKYDSTK